MAISFARMTIHTRSKGHSAVAASAYRAGISLYDERTGETHDFTNRNDVAYTEVILPTSNENNRSQSLDFYDREFLWNTAEAAEKRKDAQIAKELTLALPKELELADQIKLAKEFAHEEFNQHGLVVDFAIHDKGDDNPHAHLLITMRRVEDNQFSLKKARDLNPVFYGKDRKTVYDFWNHKWQDFQNNFFRENKIDLEVDAEFLIATRHQGRVRNRAVEHYLSEENQLRKQASFEKLSADAVLEYLSDRYATFTEHDIAKVIFKNTQNQQDFQTMMAQVKAHKHLLQLGFNDQGKEVYTTKQIYRLEQKMIDEAVTLSGRRDKAISTRMVDKISKTYSLRKEQAEAVLHLVQSGDVSCLIGRAGTGKTYAMKAVHELYARKGYKVYGAALSGVAAKALESATGIKSDTIYSLSRRIEQGKFTPKDNSVIVIDEAGMVSLKDMQRIIHYAKQSHCKVLLLGDPEQLQAIKAGAPFKAIAEHVGFVEMRNIQRQNDLADRKASIDLAVGKVGLAIDHYQNKQALQLLPEKKAKSALLRAWQADWDPNMDKSIILAHTRQQVAELNLLVREALIEKDLLADKSHKIQAINGKIDLVYGDRILFLKNNHDLKVYNGNFAVVKSIDGSKLTVQLEDRTLTFDTKKYHDFDYGYAATVHKSQGTTFDKVYIYADSYGWNKHLAYVAMTRHKEKLQIFANQERFADLDKLKRCFSRSSIRDNAIDYPLSFAKRRGFDPDSVLGRALNRIAGIGHKIRDGWLFVTNYETWVICRQRNDYIQSKQALRYEARKIAQFSDLNQSVKQGWKNYYKEHEKNTKELFSKTMTLRELVNLTTKRNQMAYDVYVQFAKYRDAIEANYLELSDLERYADLHIKRQRVLVFVRTPTELLRNRLAHDIAIDRKAHNQFVQEFGLDWKTINYANWRHNHWKTLQAKGSRQTYKTVLYYVKLRKEVAKAWSRVNAEHKGFGKNPNQERNLLRAKAITAQLDKSAYLIYRDIDKYKTALEFFKINKKALIQCVNRYRYKQAQAEKAEQTKKKIDFKSRDFLSEILSENWDANEIHQALIVDPEKTYREIFGEPKKVAGKEMRYSGGLIVTTKGTHAGKWYSFTSDQGGGPIQAIQYQMGLSYIDALKYGARLAGIYSNTQNSTNKYNVIEESIRQKAEEAEAARKARIKKEQAEKEKRIIKARKIFEYAKPLFGSVAEKYLVKHRGITDGLKRMQFKSLDGYKNIPPSLLLPTYNANNELIAVQRVFLDKKTAGKIKQAKGRIAKISTGAIKGAAGIVQIGQDGGRVYLVEGPETGATIAMADSDATVLVAFSVSNLGNLAEIAKRYNSYEIILAKDNDGKHAKSDKAFNKSLKALENADLTVHVFEPRLMDGAEKTDWNDVLKEQGIVAVRTGLGLQELKDEWEALKLKRKEITVLDEYNKQLMTTSDETKRKNLSTERDKIICELLVSKDITKLEQIAPRAIGELRNQFYHKHLSKEQQTILLHPDWNNLFAGLAQNNLLQDRIELLQDIRKNAINYLYDHKKMRRLNESMDSILRKIIKNQSQSKEMKNLAPKLHKAFKQHLIVAGQKYGLKQSREQEFERER